ncbi:hypothetical protein DFH05DRAFT_1526115 [Lentinula detonsa]|uniref:Uncharacterized protein n=1 Tax=Lentinula detonsa TaxID=2804962 RepID=A0A9W8TWV6_9AGAR|nr:hypothetical protein DFH05DRAFT_1526115 [Lentinula detonsa]
MSNSKRTKRPPKSGTGHRKAGNLSAHNHPEPETPQIPSQRASSRPKPVPNYKGTPAYEARQKPSQASGVNAEEFNAATALVAFQNSSASEAEKPPARHSLSKNIIRVPPLKPKHVVLSHMDKVLAQSMGMSQEEMIEQKECEQESGSDAWKDSDAEENPTAMESAKEHQKKKKKATVTAGTESDEAPMGFGDFEDDESEPETEEKSAWQRLIDSVDKFDIAFEVPYQTSQRNLTGITSHTTFSAFLKALATRMETRLSLLSCISYTASYKAKKANADIMLEGEDDWIVLIKDAEAFWTNSRNRKKAWSIHIHDKSMTNTKESIGIKKKKIIDSASEVEHSTSLTSDAALLVAIQKKHHCNACQAPCYVLANGDHYRYDDTDMNLWVTLVSRHSATIDKAPDSILAKLGEKSSRQKAEARHSAAFIPVTPTPPTAPAADPIQQMVLMMGAMTPLVAGMLHGRDRSPPHRSSFSSAKRNRELDSSPVALNSSPSKAPVSKNLDLDVWLPQVDSHPERGKRNANYVQYVTSLNARGIFDLDDLVHLTHSQLGDFTGMEYGYRERLFKYAREDLGVKPSKRQRNN